MADHAVGGIDGFIERGAGKTGNGEPQHRRHNRIGEILRQAFNRGAGDAGLIERLGIAADNVRYCGAAQGEVAGLERGGDIGDVPVQAALREQSAGDQRDDENAERQAQQCVLDDEGDRSDNGENDQQRNKARGTARPALGRVPIERAVERADQAADPGHRMADRGRQPPRIAQAEFEQHGQKCKRDRHDPLRRLG